MKKLFFIAILSCNFLNAQSNIFPPAGNVGIGTTAPFYKLSVASDLPSYTLGMRPSGGLGLFANNVANLNGQLGWVRRGDQAPILVLQGVQDAVAWRDVSIARDGGNVGIGTDSPAAKLDVNGNTIIADKAVPRFSLTQRSEPTVVTDNVRPYTDRGFRIYDGNSRSHLSLEAYGTAEIQAYTVTGAESNALDIPGTESSLLLNPRGGNVGVGTDSPMAKLDVNGYAIIADKAVPRFSITERSAPNVVTDNVRPYTDRGFRIYDGNSRSHLSLEAYGTAEIQAYTVTGAESNALDIPGTESGLLLNPRGGNVGIGTVNPGFKLDVIGTVRAREVRVNLSGADFVFEDSYKLMPLNELEKFIKKNKHLPEIAPAKEMQEKGGDLGGLSVQLLQKIEELTLHAIEQNKKVEELTLHAIEQNKKIEILESKLK